MHAGAGPTPRELQIGVLHIGEGARIEQRDAGGAARAPVLRDLLRLGDAELAGGMVVGDAAQGFLIDDRDLRPLLRIIEAILADMVELAPVEWRLAGIAQRDRLALALDARDVGFRFRQLQIDHAALAY